jgi:hypothetical protein
MIHADRARYYEQLGKYAEAAADLNAYATGDDPRAVMDFRVQQMIDLARGGKAMEARNVAEMIYGNAPLRTVLKLQVKLRNAHFSEQKFTGKFDEETKKTLEFCLSEPTCFSSISGTRV